MALRSCLRTVNHHSHQSLRLTPSLSCKTFPNGLYRLMSAMTANDCYWRSTPWKNVPADEFNSHRFQVRNTVTKKHGLEEFLVAVLPATLNHTSNDSPQAPYYKEDFMADVIAGMNLASMAIRLTPHILSRVDWSSPVNDPIRKQFIPLASDARPDHEQLQIDSLHEQQDSPVPGLVHRYPGRALFLATSICPVYCRFCTRSYAVGDDTVVLQKKPQKPSRKRWEIMFRWIEDHPDLEDIVVSGGDAYYLEPDMLREIGERLLSIEHVRRIRFASKGLSVLPGRIQEGEPWTETLIDLSNQGRRLGKQICLHTHINHPREVTWVTSRAANYLFEHGVIVRNQAVLLKGVNNDFETLSSLIKTLSRINIQPYYVYQCDMVKGIEALRTPLAEIITLDKQIRGTVSGFMVPAFVVDLPGGGGKRLVSTYESYNTRTGVSTFTAPGLHGSKGSRTYTYHDPKA